MVPIKAMVDKKMSVKRRRASSPVFLNLVPKFVGVPSTPRLASRYEQILEAWTSLDSKPSLKNNSGLKCSRFLLDKKIITVREIALPEELDGTQSEIYAIDIGDDVQPVILKKFTPTGDTNNEPEIEAELQKWAHRQTWTDCHGFITHGFAPDVKAYNKKAMIIEKCQRSLNKGALTNDRTYSRMPGFTERSKLYELNELLGWGSLKIYSFVQNMFDACGLYNKDPNFGNYMYLREELKQIDFGQNRFGSEAKFNEFYEQLPVHLQRPDLRKTLLVVDSSFPPLYHWYTVMSTDADGTQQQQWERGAWGPFIVSLKQMRQVILNKAAAQKSALTIPTSALCTTYLNF
tara:strand:+ start:1154 stop:2194 length:1041 start_codon:yes stop_codon:yes gene_type:complete